MRTNDTPSQIERMLTMGNRLEWEPNDEFLVNREALWSCRNHVIQLICIFITMDLLLSVSFVVVVLFE